MRINEDIKEELLTAIKNRTSESFETTVVGGLKHFISSEGNVQGLYIGTIRHDEKDFKIYMI